MLMRRHSSVAQNTNLHQSLTMILIHLVIGLIYTWIPQNLDPSKQVQEVTF